MLTLYSEEECLLHFSFMSCDLFLPLVSLFSTAESLVLRQAGSALCPLCPRQAVEEWHLGLSTVPFFWNHAFAIHFMFTVPFTCLFCSDLLISLPLPSWSYRRTHVTKVSNKCSYPTELFGRFSTLSNKLLHCLPMSRYWFTHSWSVYGIHT